MNRRRARGARPPALHDHSDAPSPERDPGHDLGHDHDPGHEPGPDHEHEDVLHHDNDHDHVHDHDHDHVHDHDHERGHRHGHEHVHGHSLSHGRDELIALGRRRLAIVLGLTIGFMVVELVGGLLANSLALVADAGHMLSDAGAIGLSIFALWFARRPATPAKTYGYLRLEILAALANGVTLVVISLAIFWQAYQRLRNPQPVEGALMLGVAVAGLVVNVIAALMLHGSAGHNLNVRGAYLHVLGDLLGSAGAIAAAIIILTTGWLPADPLISCLVGLLILFGSWRLIRESVDVLLEAVPRQIDLEAVHRAIAGIPGVDEVHDLHVWTLASGYLAMSGHCLVDDPGKYKGVLETIHTRMHDHFGISHVTFQVEHRTMYPLKRRRE
jgi:cobalt-zinc-cadmium efflux system protein